MPQQPLALTCVPVRVSASLMVRTHVAGRRLVLCLLVALAAPLTAAGQQGQSPNGDRVVSAIALQDEDTVSLDGRLDEAAWQRAEPATDFIQQDPTNGAPATERTEVRLLFDKQRLYLGVICYDSEPSALRASQMQRDADLGSDDRFMWSIDTFLDGRTGYFFEINPLGLMGDGLIGEGDSGPVGFSGSAGSIGGGGGGGGAGGRVNKQWDGIWVARVSRNAGGWSAEIELPFRTFNFNPANSTWGINFQRTVRRKNEESVWAGHARNQGLLRMTNAGRVTGLTEKSQGTGLDIKPYGVASVTAAPGRDVPAAVGDTNAGLDIFYNLTPSLRANFTINTDFAETEVDQRRVNLTRFPLFFPEKRDFFLEGSGFFDFAREPGNAIEPFFSRRIGLDANGNPQKIDFGLKLTGQVGGQDVGLLQVRTGEDEGAVGEDFTVLRVRRRMLTQSYVGLLYTRRAARESAADDFHTVGVDFNLGTSSFRGKEQLEINGFGLWGTDPFGAGQNYAYGVRLNYPNDVWSGRIGWREHGQHYGPAVGFVQRTGYRRFFPVFRFSPPPLRNHRYIRRFAWETMVELLTDLDNQLLERRFSLNLLQMILHAGDQFQVQLVDQSERLDDDFEIHEGIVLPVGNEYSFTRFRVVASSASQRRLSARTEFETGGFYSGDRRELTLTLTTRPRSGLTASFESEWNRLTLAEGAFATRLYRALVNTQFSPWISLGNNLQYDSVSGILGWQARFRWILRPGNDLYFVYTHNWREYEREPFRTLDRRAATKINYTHRF